MTDSLFQPALPRPDFAFERMRRDLQVRAGRRPPRGGVAVQAVLGDLLERVERRAGLGETAGRRERDATRVLSHAPRIRQVGGGKRQREQLVPMAERDERQVGILQVRLGERDLPRSFYGRRRRRALRGGDGERAPAREGSREREEVMVVRVVPDRVEPLWLLSLDVDLVG